MYHHSHPHHTACSSRWVGKRIGPHRRKRPSPCMFRRFHYSRHRHIADPGIVACMHTGPHPYRCPCRNTCHTSRHIRRFRSLCPHNWVCKRPYMHRRRMSDRFGMCHRSHRTRRCRSSCRSTRVSKQAHRVRCCILRLQHRTHTIRSIHHRHTFCRCSR